MVIDARSIPSQTVIESDVAIVGAGAAGISLAREFIGHDVRICLLESGGFEFDNSTQSLYEGKNIGLPYHPLDTCRLRLFGGTTKHWGGWCRPLDEIDFKERDWIPYSGWPFDKSHLDPYYERAQPICGLGPSIYDSHTWNKDRKVKLFLFPGGRVRTTIFQTSQAPRFGEVYRREISAAENIRTILHANLVGIETDITAKTATRLRVATLEGNELFVSAKSFVLAMGGIENARLLLVSNTVQRAGLGNQNDLVGRFFMDHPTITMGILLPSEPYSQLGLEDYHSAGGANFFSGAVSLSEDVQRQERLSNHCAILRRQVYEEEEVGDGVASFKYLWRSFREQQLPEEFAHHLKNVITDIDLVAVTLHKRIRSRARPLALLNLGNHSEPVPNPESRVSLSSERDKLGLNRAQLDWRLSELDKINMRRFLEILAREVGRFGLGRVRILLNNDNSWPIPPPESPWTGPRGAYHHMGTTRMSKDPQKGVVDENCRVHRMSNLFVAGSSVFPTSGYANPTLTIVALALRLADHMKSEMRK